MSALTENIKGFKLTIVLSTAAAEGELPLGAEIEASSLLSVLSDVV